MAGDDTHRAGPEAATLAPTDPAAARTATPTAAPAPPPRRLTRAVRRLFAAPRRLAAVVGLALLLGAALWLCGGHLIAWHHLRAGRDALARDHFRVALEHA